VARTEDCPDAVTTIVGPPMVTTDGVSDLDGVAELVVAGACVEDAFADVDLAALEAATLETIPVVPVSHTDSVVCPPQFCLLNPSHGVLH